MLAGRSTTLALARRPHHQVLVPAAAPRRTFFFESKPNPSDVNYSFNINAPVKYRHPHLANDPWAKREEPRHHPVWNRYYQLQFAFIGFKEGLIAITLLTIAEWAYASVYGEKKETEEQHHGEKKGHH